MVDTKTVRKVATIARLQLTEKEVEQFAADMERILAAFDDLKAIDVADVKPSFQPLEVTNVMRDDKEEPCLSQEEALTNTKNKEKGYFKGPRVM